MKKQSNPWEQKPSRDLTAEEIRRHCKSDLKAWDEFLKADVEVPCQEVLLEDPCTIDSFTLGYNDLVDEPKPEASNAREIAFVHELLDGLTIREREVIESYFWRKESERQAASRLKISRGTVRNYRDNALKKMGQMAVNKVLAYKKFKETAE